MGQAAQASGSASASALCSSEGFPTQSEEPESTSSLFRSTLRLLFMRRNGDCSATDALALGLTAEPVSEIGRNGDDLHTQLNISTRIIKLTAQQH